MNTNHSIRMQVLCALFAAVCAVCSQLTIPIQPVPITLGTFGVLMAGGFRRETLWASCSSDLSHSGGSWCAGLFDDACGDLCPGRAFGRIHPWFCADGFRGGAGI